MPMLPEPPTASVPAPASPAEIAAELTQAVHDLNARGLFPAAQWAAEQLVGLDLHSTQPAAFAWHNAQTSQAAGFSGRPSGPRTDPDEQHPLYLLARSYFQAKEYRRSAHALGSLSGPLPTFLRLYATYMAGEKRREEDRVEKGGVLGRAYDTVNPELEGLEAALAAQLGLTPTTSSPDGGAAAGATGAEGSGRAAAAGSSASGGGAGSQQQAQDPFLLYLYGVVLSGRGRTAEALDALVASLRAYPCNWSAWLAVQSICSGAATGGAPGCGAGLPAGPAAAPSSGLACPGASAAALLLPAGLPVHWAREFFLAAVSLSSQHNQEALSRLHGLSQLFRGSLSVEAAVAQAHYNLQNFDDAQALYEDLLMRDPFRLEGTDTFSNILFVKEASAPLSVLAHRVAATDKYRPETCCVMGNYYSLQGTHEKAIEYFRRALRLDPRYLAAWTLMGHEYMEVKNTPAAIDAYRRAIDVSPQDFRAWYGLGQAYELLKMPFYALYYYRRAAQLRPTDGRMWCALAQCYIHEQVGMQDAAIRAYQRAVANNDPDGIAAHKLAKLYETRGELTAAEQLFRHSLERLEAQGPEALQSQDAIEALSFLAAHCKDTGRLEEAEALCARLMDVGGPAKERAKVLAREIRNLQQFTAAAGPGGGGGGAGSAVAGRVASALSTPMDAEVAYGSGGAARAAAGVSPVLSGLGSRQRSQFPSRPGALAATRTSIFAAAGSTAPSAAAVPAGAVGNLGGAAAGLGGQGLGVGLALGLGPHWAELGLGGGGGGGGGGSAREGLSVEELSEELGGCDPLAVLAVMQQLQFDRPSAVAVLQRAGGDPVAAVREYWYPSAGGRTGEGGADGQETV